MVWVHNLKEARFGFGGRLPSGDSGSSPDTSPERWAISDSQTEPHPHLSPYTCRNRPPFSLLFVRAKKNRYGFLVRILGSPVSGYLKAVNARMLRSHQDEIAGVAVSWVYVGLSTFVTFFSGRIHRERGWLRCLKRGLSPGFVRRNRCKWLSCLSTSSFPFILKRIEWIGTTCFEQSPYQSSKVS